jgi:hypothetical protein
MKLRWKIAGLLATALVYLQLELYWFASSSRVLHKDHTGPVPQRQQRLQTPVTDAFPPMMENRSPTHLPHLPITFASKQTSTGSHRAADRGVPTCSHFDQPPFDGQVRQSPGGTEDEALRERRELSLRNWPINANRKQQQVWRSRPRPVLDECLGSFQAVLNREELSIIERALPMCGNEVNFSCLISATEELLGAGGANAACRGTYGAGLIDKFRRSERPMCVSRLSDVSISCKSIRAHESHEIETSICRARNFSVFFPAIEDGDFPWLKFSPGAFSLAGCNVPPSARAHWHFMHSQADWMDLGFETGEVLPCDDVVTTPTFFETRSGDYSPFAVTHDWINALILLAAEDVKPSEVQIVMMDRMTVGFYTPMWQLGFSPANQLQWYTDLRERFQGKRVCFGKGWFNIPARLSPIYNEDDCTGSPLYRLYSEYLLWVLGAHRTRPSRLSLVVTLIVRRNYETGHAISRRFKNERELLDAMRKNFGEGVSVNAVDYAWFDFDQQVNISRATDVLVAMHGAGLVQMMFLPEWGGVFEFFCPEKPASNFRYKQLAAKMGLSYASLSIENDENEVPLATAVHDILRLVRHVRNMKARHDTLQSKHS